MSGRSGAHIHVAGVVQGVGFRPFVYGLARRLALTGWVRNTSAGVDLEVDGTGEALAAFVRALREEAPPLARVEEVRVEHRAPNGFSAFEIVASQAAPDAYQPISPDVSLCADCLRELFDPRDRRYRYPFINCTNCGPRFTLILDTPYDRPRTTMRDFAMCPACAAEYADPADRRFHAEPVACPSCGPHLWLEVGGERVAEREEALQTARRLVREGRLLALKGIGGFHLACDARNPAAVTELRRRKARADKPLAVMMANAEVVRRHCLVGEAEQALLESRERPIVILPRRDETSIAPQVAPGQCTLGVMLPYSPLHARLLEPEAGIPEALVMTSGNRSEEPIATTNQGAREQLEGIADAFLVHDREIHARCDDSVVRLYSHRTTSNAAGSELLPLRRGRGYAPHPLRLPREAPPLLATGPELKNTFCLTRGTHAFLSQHIGDLGNFETLQAYEQGLAHLEALFRVRPEALAHDQHPHYLTTRYARERAEREGLPVVAVQHHHAHLAACMAENGLPGAEPAIGAALDGTGYGDDGAIWGGEFMLADYAGFQRAHYLAYVRMPAGEAAVRAPWRMALAWLHRAGIEWTDDLAPVRAAAPAALRAVRQQLETGVNAPLTSSMGRLFDAVSSLAGVRQQVYYEAQAAIEFEALLDPSDSGAYRFAVGDPEVDAAPVIRAVVADLRAGVDVGRIAARFHAGVALMIYEVCGQMRARSGVAKVALSGGVWQNMALLARTVPLLEKGGFTVYLHHHVPPNDGGVALGQAVIAAYRLTGAG